MRMRKNIGRKRVRRRKKKKQKGYEWKKKWRRRGGNVSLQVWLPLIDDVHNQGVSGTTVVNNGATVNTSGKIGSCYAFNGSTGYIALSGSDLFKIFTGGTQQFSITMWVFHADATRAILFGDYATSGGIGFNIELSTAHGVRFYWNGAPDTYPANATVAASGWTHVALTYDGTKLQSYINGVEKGSWSGTLAEKNKTSGEFRLGRDNRSDSTAFNGRMNDFRIYDHALSAAEVKEISQGLVLHYPLNRNSLKPIGTNLVTGVTKGGQTTLLTDGRVGVITSGTNADTYFTVNLSESITNGTTYYLSCDVSDVSDGQYWGFPLGAQNNTSMPSKFYNGHNEYIFTANDINWGANRLFLDDNYRNDYAHPASFYNFVLIKNPTFVTVDGSGYNHHGSTTENLIFNSETGRYSSSTKLNSSSPTDNSETGITYILSPLALTTPNQMTVAWWAKPESGYGGNTGHAAFCTSVNSRPTDYNTTAMHHRDAGFDLCPNSGSAIRLTFNQYTANQWHHYAITYDGQKATAYRDGVALTNTSMSAAGPLKSFNNIWIGYSQAGGVKRKTLGSYSDFRVYVTSLSADDILSLYHTGAKIDNKQNLHSFEFNEASQQKITKLGQVIWQNLLETYIPLYDKNIYTESDGSTWIHIFHHNNPAASKFNETTLDWTTGKYLDTDRWYDVDQAIYDTSEQYEFMVKQKTTDTATEVKYRWSQTVNPLTATWDDVKPGTVTFNTSSGYTSSSYGGLYLFKTSNLHMCIANGSNGNWYGGIGAATAYNGGIPGYPNTTVTNGYIDLYIRVYNGTKIIKNIGISSSEFIEL